MSFESKTAQLLTQAKEYVKQYVALDVADRPSIVYTAATAAEHGTPCSKVQYVYKDATSAIVVKMKESAATWDSSYDIP